MKHVEKDEDYTPHGIYWVLTGMIGNEYQYALLGRFIHGVFEFNNKLAKPGYVFQSNVNPILTYFRS